LRDGLRYLTKTGDSLFHPDSAHQPWSRPSIAVSIAQLRDPSPSVRLSALWDLREAGTAAASATGAVRECLDDREPTIRYEAILTLGACGPGAASAIPGLLEGLRSEDLEWRKACATALANIGEKGDPIIAEIARLLRSGEKSERRTAANALGKLACPSTTKALVQAFPRALADLDVALIDALAAALVAIDPDPRADVRKYLADADAEILHGALDAVSRCQERFANPQEA
jgi:HEAT repeat protein